MTCKEDGCELSHCKQCGQHFGYSSSHTCEDCEYDKIYTNMNKVNYYTRRYHRFIPNKEEVARINEVTIEDMPCSGIKKRYIF